MLPVKESYEAIENRVFARDEVTTAQDLLAQYRRIMNSIHEVGNIFYDAGRMKAYNVIALIASDLRQIVRG